MTAPRIRLAIGAATAILTAECGTNTPSSTTAPSTTTFHAEVTDPVGDAVASPGVPNPSDMVRGTVDVIGGSVTFAIQFAPATLDRQTTRLTIELDTDQNLWVSNSLSGGDRELDKVVAVGDPPHTT